MIRTTVTSLALALTFGANAGEVQAAGPSYEITREVALGAPDRWDYVVFDQPSGRVFAAHGDRVSVVNGRTGAVLGAVLGIPGGTHGIAISNANGRGYTDDGKAGTVNSFDLKTLRLAGSLPSDPDADGMTLDSASGHIFVANGDSGTVTVIDPKADTVITKVAIGAKLEFLVADGTGKIYVNGAERKEVVRIDARSNTVDARWSIPACESPHGLAIDTARRRLFVSCVNARLMVLNADTGAQVAMLPIGRGSDAAAYDPSHRRVFSSNGVDGTLTVIQQDDADRYRILDTVPTRPSARTMAVDPVTGRLYLAAADPLDTPTSGGGKPKPKPGSFKLLFLDPVG